MHFARKACSRKNGLRGEARDLAVEVIRDEVAVGRLIIPANVNIRNGSRWDWDRDRCKVNATSAIGDHVEHRRELRKLHMASSMGGHVMGFVDGRDIRRFATHPAALAGPVGTSRL